MKKNLFVLSTLAVAGVASAQSSVTLFGVIDVGVSQFESKSKDIFGNTTKTSKSAVTSGGHTTSRIGFRGQEDLGGGLAASFWLESALLVDDGTTGGNVANSGSSVSGFFNRRSTLSLSGAFGEVRLGRDYTPTFWSDSIFDPFATSGIGTNLISTANGFSNSSAAVNGFQVNNMYARASNSVGYFLPPNLGGFYGQVMYTFNEKEKYAPGALTPKAPDNSRTGRYVGGRFGYANGPLNVAVASGETTVGDAFFAGLTSKLRTFNIGSSYDFDVAKLFGEYSKVDLKTQSSGIVPAGVFYPSPEASGFLIGLTVPIDASLIRLSYSQVDVDKKKSSFPSIGDPKAHKWAIGYVYNLSKRTALYSTFAQINNKNGYDLGIGGSPNFIRTGTVRPTTSRGFDVGLKTVF